MTSYFKYLSVVLVIVISSILGFLYTDQNIYQKTSNFHTEHFNNPQKTPIINQGLSINPHATDRKVDFSAFQSKNSDDTGTSNKSSITSGSFDRAAQSTQFNAQANDHDSKSVGISGADAYAALTGSSQSIVIDFPMTNGAPIREIKIPVPEGAKVPALFFDDAPKPPPQTKALDKIATEFEENVSEIPLGMTKEEVWEEARRIADESYIILFGYQAFNQYHIQSAKEALKEKQIRSNASQP
jgi:hypothetical protein